MTLTSGILSLEGTFDGILASFILTTGLSFIPAGLIVFIITEKIEGVKH